MRWVVSCCLLLQLVEVTSFSSPTSIGLSSAFIVSTPTRPLCARPRLTALRGNSEIGAPHQKERRGIEQRDLGGFSVCVVGGGPVGFAAALRLLAISWVTSVTIVEKRPFNDFDDGPGTYGISFSGRSTQVLEKLPGNPLDNILEEATTVQGLFRANRPIMRKGLFKALMEEFGESGRLELEFGRSVERVDEEARMAVLSGGGRVGYDLLVVADGIHSGTARALGKEALVCRKSASWRVMNNVRVPPLRPGLELEGGLALTCGDGASTAGAFTKGEVAAWLMSEKDGGMSLLLFFDHSDGASPWGAATGEELRAEITARMRPSDDVAASYNLTSAELTAYFASLDNEVYDFLVQSKPRHFWTGRCKEVVDVGAGIALAGDAAGGMLGTLGQGVQRGYKDAEDIGRFLEQAYSKVQQARGKEKEREDDRETKAQKSEVVRLALALYGEEVQGEREAVRSLSLLFAMPWRQHVPADISAAAHDPGHSYRSALALRKRTRPLVWIAKVYWRLNAVQEHQINAKK